eukprot:502673_1
MSARDRRAQMETVPLNNSDESITIVFDKYSDGKFQRRRARKKSIDVMAIQDTLLEMGVKVSMVEIFGVLKDYQCPSGMHGRIEYEEFLVILRNARSKNEKNAILVAAFNSLGGSTDEDRPNVSVANVVKSIAKLKEFNVDIEKLETVCSSKEETESMDFNEFAACFENE